MCGIAGIHIFKPEEFTPKYSKMEYAVDALFAAINHRGGDATGFVAIGDDGRTEWQKASCDAFDFYKERRPIPWNTRSVLLHTRMATQGSAAFPENNHPVRRGSVYIVHNGHIWNDWEVFKKTNRTRYGQVDSEAIAAIVAKYGIYNTHKAMEEVAGAAAIGAVDEKVPGLMVLARGSSSPLMFYHNEHAAVFASTIEAVKKAWSVLYGTPPSEKNIRDVDEGTALYLSEIVREEEFVADFGYQRYATTKSYTTKSYTQMCSISKCYKTSTFTTANGERLCEEHASEYVDFFMKDYDDDIDGNYDDDIVARANTISQWGVICVHDIEKRDCEICTPDDEYGSFLPENLHPNLKTPFEKQYPLRVNGEIVRSEDLSDARMYDEITGEWASARQCDLCNNWFPEGDLALVEGWEEKWLFCDGCCEEMSDILADYDVTKPSNANIITYPLNKSPLFASADDEGEDWLNDDPTQYLPSRALVKSGWE